MTKTEAVAVVIAREGRFLLGKRSRHKRSAPGYWCPVTGKIEAGEAEEQAVVREAREETGLVVEPVRKLASFDTRDGSTVIHWWLVRIVSGEPRLANDEHEELRWVGVEEMAQLSPLFEEDLELYRAIAPGLRPG